MASLDPTLSPEEQAALWAARSAYGELTAGARAELDEWLAADRRNRGAYIRAQAGIMAMENAVIAGPSLPMPDNDNGRGQASLEAPTELPLGWSSRLFRWSGRAAGATAAIAACAIGVVVLDVPLFRTPDEMQSAGLHQVALADGSVAMLGDQAEISVAMEDNIRRITLQRGEAVFRVAKDPSRPFVVRSGDVYAQATGTVYSVRRLGVTGGTVQVSEGSVLVWARDERDQAVLLHAGGKLTLEPGPQPDVAAPQAPVALPPPALAQISLDNVPIATAVTRFNRINRTKIVVEDPAIGEVRIVGLFNANDPQRFAEAAAAVAGGRATNKSGKIVIDLKH